MFLLLIAAASLYFILQEREQGLLMLVAMTLVAAISDGLRAPERHAAGRRRMLAEVLTYTDGESSRRLVAEVRHLLDPGEAPSG